MTRASTIRPAKINVDPRPAGPADPGAAAAPGGANGGGDGDGGAEAAECPSEGAAHPFTDVPSSSFAFEAVACLHELGITTGRTPTGYDPTAAVTREQMAVFLTRLYTFLPAAP